MLGEPHGSSSQANSSPKVSGTHHATNDPLEWDFEHFLHHDPLPTSRMVGPQWATMQGDCCALHLPLPTAPTGKSLMDNPHNGQRRNFCPPEWKDSFCGTRLRERGTLYNRHTEVRRYPVRTCNPCAQPQTWLRTRTHPKSWRATRSGSTSFLVQMGWYSNNRPTPERNRGNVHAVNPPRDRT